MTLHILYIIYYINMLIYMFVRPQHCSRRFIAKACKTGKAEGSEEQRGNAEGVEAHLRQCAARCRFSHWSNNCTVCCTVRIHESDCQYTTGKHLAWLSISQADTSRHCSECKLTNVASRSHTLAAVYDSDLLSEHWTCGFRQAFRESMEQ